MPVVVMDTPIYSVPLSQKLSLKELLATFGTPWHRSACRESAGVTRFWAGVLVVFGRVHLEAISAGELSDLVGQNSTGTLRFR